MNVLKQLLEKFGINRSASLPTDRADLPGDTSRPHTETGRRPTLLDQANRLYMQMHVNLELRQSIHDIRILDRMDLRVKRIHGRTARTAVKGGLVLNVEAGNQTLKRRWDAFVRRCNLNARDKLESDFRGIMAEGNLPLQVVISLDDKPQVIRLVRMPAETIVPMVDETGRYKDPAHAFNQIAWPDERVLGKFALWQLILKRLSPDNFDDMGSMGRPYLDASRKVWKQLRMTEEDMVIRRRTRAPQRVAHLLKGISEPDLRLYRAGVEQDQSDGNFKDYFTNREGSIQPISGDANLDQVADVVYLLDTAFAGAPAPKGLFGYAGDLQRDILEDLRRDYYDELDSMQELVAEAYEQAFRFDLLLSNINPDATSFSVAFAERKSETPNQRADLALKYRAAGASSDTVLRTVGLDPDVERRNREKESNDLDPYPTDVAGQTSQPNVSITPGNERKNESGTAISNR